MVIGGYLLDLYCDSKEKHEYKEGSAQYAGVNLWDCIAQARGQGWSFTKNQRECFCPIHKKEKRAHAVIVKVQGGTK